MKCYPSSTHNFTLRECCRRIKYRGENTSVRFVFELAYIRTRLRRSLPECWTRMRYVYVRSNSPKKNKVAFVRAEVGMKKGGCDFLRSSCRSLDTEHEMTHENKLCNKLMCPSAFVNFVHLLFFLFPDNVVTLFHIWKYRNALLGIISPAWVYLRWDYSNLYLT